MKYIVAVSGGVDSMALLHMLATSTTHELVVAHVDHGIRQNSHEDARFVEWMARQYGVQFELVRLGLGPNASEASARQARYEWLDGIKQKHGAHAVVTAHHQDDVFETVALNTVRGTGWRGLASLRSGDDRYRPLLGLSKAQLLRYAIDHQLEWREDSTNEDVRYTRNWLRHGVIPRLTAEQRAALHKLVVTQHDLRTLIDSDVKKLTHELIDKDGVRRYQLIMLPETVSLEVLREASSCQLTPPQVRKLLHFVKTGRRGTKLHVGNKLHASLTPQHVRLEL